MGSAPETRRCAISGGRLVREPQQEITWLSRALVELDADSREVPSALVKALARLFTVWLFAEEARDHAGREPT